MRSWIYIGFMLAACIAQAQDLHLRIRPVFGAQSLELHGRQYLTPTGGDSLRIEAFRFYMTGIQLMRDNKPVYTERDSYHLIDAEDSSTWIITLPAAAGDFDALCFSIGVDSLANVSGAMGGDLDPAKGMYWAWNSGYINAKLEGSSPACKTLHHAFEFHIGGFALPYNTRREIRMSCHRSSDNTIRLQADAAAWLEQIDLKSLNSVVMPSAQAVKLADNYRHMIRLSH
jgi:hypothetical protein